MGSSGDGLQTILGIRPNLQRLSANILYYFLGVSRKGRSRRLVSRARKRTSKGHRSRDFGSRLPSAKNRAIAAVLSDMDAELTALEAATRPAPSSKEMMQDLLTGKDPPRQMGATPSQPDRCLVGQPWPGVG